jgi:type IV secretion system protein VirB5
MKVKIPGSKSAAGGSQAEPIAESPYLNAQNAWLERYGSFIQQAYNWRLLAMLEAVAIIIGVFGLIYVAGQSKFIPYIVDVNQEGLPINVHLADQAGPVDQRVVHAELANWISNARSVVTDRIVEKQNIDGMFDMVQNNSAASGFLNSYYPVADHSPFQRATSLTDAVQVTAILPVSNQTYVVQWTETIRDLNGRVTSTQNWEGSISVAFTPPTTEDQVIKNPIGMFITSVSWTQKS